MNPVYLNHFLAALRFLSGFQRALHFTTGKEAQKDQIEAVDQVKGGEYDETHEDQ
jgi:hypothetical protein